MKILKEKEKKQSEIYLKHNSNETSAHTVRFVRLNANVSKYSTFHMHTLLLGACTYIEFKIEKKKKRYQYF